MQGLSKLIIRPFRERYSVEKDLGPKNFIVKGKVYTRKDFAIINSRGLAIQCSWFLPKFSRIAYPCMIYCHGNCGSRCDSLDIAKVLLPVDISVFTFDFTGSGLSEGDYVTLGYYESWDIKTVVEYIRESGHASSIGLWGRSMGAASSILYASCDPMISVLVLDSPFTSLKQVTEDLLTSYKVPAILFKYLFQSIREHIIAIANFDILEVSPIKFAQSCQMPAIFMHGIKDKLVPISQSRELYDVYSADKYLLELGGGHNSPRPAQVLERVIEILTEVLDSPQPSQEYLEEGMKTIRGLPPSFKINVSLKH